MTGKYSWCVMFLIVLSLPAFAGCNKKKTGGGIFLDGCPEAGRAVARKLSRGEMKMTGPDAIGGLGDWLLMNEKAAFIVTGVERLKTYWYYGGILVDAVALKGCAQAGPEQFGELALIMGRMDGNDFTQSVLRGFRGERVELINDGANGRPAIVRVHGRDDYFWVVELTLVVSSFQAGKRKALSVPMDVDIWVDYILAPGSNVLQIELTLKNRKSQAQEVLVGSALWLGDTTRRVYYADSPFDIGGFDLEVGVPWVAAASKEGSLAFAVKDGTGTTFDISGVSGILDANQVVLPPLLGPAGGGSDTYREVFLVSVGATDINSAVKHLQPLNPGAFGAQPYTLHPVEGLVEDQVTGLPLAGADIDIQIKDEGGNWRTLDGFVTDEEGRFAGEIPDLGSPTKPYRLLARVDGRPAPDPVTFTIPEKKSFKATIAPGGTLVYTIKDGDGKGLPAKILLWQNGREVGRYYSTTGMGREKVPPGDYTVSVTRGYEYEPHEGALTITASAETALNLTLAHVVDTTGFLSVDSHVHAGPSADSMITVPLRIKTAAAEGQEVLVGTDHEVITDWSWGVKATSLEEWVATVVGQEVTATIPEHTNMFPVKVTNVENDRGDFPRWYGLDIDQIYAAERARGAKVVQLNHPRLGCNYMCHIGYDRITGMPGLTDPTALALPAGAKLWSWNFNAIEYMNGNRDPFLDPAHPERTGIFEDWMSFLNHGHRITAVAVTDIHGIDSPGNPRSYFLSSTDAPARFKEADLVSSMVEGRLLVSTGAFARVKVNGTAGMGDTVTDQDGEVALKVHIEALPAIDVTHFKVFVNCDEVKNIATTAPDGVVKYDGTITVPVTRDAHLVVLGFGAKYLPRGLKQFNPARVPRFTTNAIYIDHDGNGTYDHPGGKTCAYDLLAP